MSALRFISAMLMLLLAVEVGARAAQPSDQQAADWIDEASKSFDEGASVIRSDRAKAEPLLRRSIESFQRVIAEAGIRNGGLYYNIANAYALLGDDGRAVLNYRRAQRFSPSDPNLRANLALIQDRLPDRVAPSSGDRVAQTLLFWHYDLSAPIRFWIFVGASGVAWLLGIARAMGFVRFGVARPMLGLLAVAVLFLGSLAVDEAASGRTTEAVIVGGPVVGRKGPDVAGYEPSFRDPLHPGVEVRITERRGEWALVRLADGRETWLPGESLELLWPLDPAH